MLSVFFHGSLDLLLHSVIYAYEVWIRNSSCCAIEVIVKLVYILRYCSGSGGWSAASGQRWLLILERIGVSFSLEGLAMVSHGLLRLIGHESLFGARVLLL